MNNHDCLKARAAALRLNISTRFPGFTKKVDDAFWKWEHDIGYHVDGDRFLRHLLADCPDGIDVRDCAKGSSDVAQITLNVSKISEWAKSVILHNEVIEEIMDGRMAIPIIDKEAWSDKIEIVSLKKENSRLRQKISSIEEVLENDPAKRKTSISKFIIGIAVKWYRYNDKIRNNISDSISMDLKSVDYYVSQDVVRDIIRNADSHLKNESD